MKLKPVTGNRVEISDAAAAPPRNAPSGDALEKATDKQYERLNKLQRLFYADGRYALLIVLQGRDASGKDGVIRKVIGAVDPLGCEQSSFGVPTEEELKHDFLWRIHKRIPGHGTIGVFNRSHYEDVLVVRVNNIVPKKVWSKRFDQINDFERLLSASNVVILKFFLHVSRDEQKKRLEERLSDRTKNWKFREGDLVDRANWGEFTKAYRDVLTKCSPSNAPWYVVPADDKDVRNYLIARTVADTIDSLDLKYPKAAKDVRDIQIV